MNLGVLDLGRELAGCSPADRAARTVELARLAEDHGFRRYWVAEHHVGGTVIAAPEVAVALIAAGTNTIRVGPGGVLLRYYSPLKVAEVYLTLEAAFPQRIELGVCRGPGVADERVALALVSGNLAELEHDSYDRKLDELFALLDTRAAADLLGPPIRSVAPPPIWVLGSGESSVEQAVRYRSRYGFMCFFPGSESFGPALVSRYLDRRNGVGEGPMIAVSAVCAATDARAARTHEELQARGYLASNVVGGPQRCAEAIGEIAATYRATDVMLACASPEHADQRNLITLLGEALG